MEVAQNRLRFLRGILVRANSDNRNQAIVRIDLDEVLLHTLRLAVETLPIVALIHVQLDELFRSEESVLLAEFLTLLLKTSMQNHPSILLFVSE